MKNQKGTSLVSVIVSFAVLMIVMLLLQVSITASGRYAAEADKIWKDAVAAENKYVNDINTGTIRTVTVVMQQSGTTYEEAWGHLQYKETTIEDDETVKLYYISH